MRDWIVVGVLYVLALGLFRVLGGWGSAADVFRRWGTHSAGIRTNPGSSS
jgi:hypothetical protein